MDRYQRTVVIKLPDTAPSAAVQQMIDGIEAYFREISKEFLERTGFHLEIEHGHLRPSRTRDEPEDTHMHKDSDECDHQHPTQGARDREALDSGANQHAICHQRVNRYINDKGPLGSCHLVFVAGFDRYIPDTFPTNFSSFLETSMAVPLGKGQDLAGREKYERRDPPPIQEIGGSTQQSTAPKTNTHTGRISSDLRAPHIGSIVSSSTKAPPQGAKSSRSRSPSTKFASFLA